MTSLSYVTFGKDRYYLFISLTIVLYTCWCMIQKVRGTSQIKYSTFMRILDEGFDAWGCWMFICGCCHNALYLYLPLSSFFPWNNLFSISTVCHLVFPFQLSLSWWFFSFCFMLWMRCLCGFLLDVFMDVSIRNHRSFW